MKHLLSLMCLLFIGEASASQILKSGLDEVINRAIKEDRIVGTVVMVAKKGEIIYQRAAGMSDKENARVMEMETVFRLSSLSKPVSSLAALSLVDQGILKLTDPVTKYIPDFRPRLPDGSEPVITIKHLLTHTAGMGYGFFEPANGPYRSAGVSDGMDAVEFDLSENLRRLVNVPLYYPPGAAWSYSVGVDVLGEVMSRATGLSLPEVIQTHVTGPLKMNSTSFNKEVSNLAVPYVNGPMGTQRINDGDQIPFGPSYISFSPSRDLDSKSFHSAGAGILGSAPDYLKLLEAIRSENSILSSKSFSGLKTDQVPELSLAPVFPGAGWTLGMMVVRNPSEARTYASKGTLTWSGVYGHNFWIDLENEISVIVMTNTTFEGMMGQFAQEVQAAVYKY